MRTTITAVATALLAGSLSRGVRAAEAPGPEREGAELLFKDLGPDAVELLRDRNYVVLQGNAEDGRLQYVHWPALEDLAGAAQDILSTADAYARFLDGGAPAAPGSDLRLSALRRLPSWGLSTPGILALAQALAAAHQQLQSLESPNAGGSVPAGSNLFETSWGAAYAARTRADLLEDLEPLAPGYFNEFLGGVRPNAAAIEHFTVFISSAFGRDVSGLLDNDAQAGAASPELRSWLGKYLRDQRRLQAVKTLKLGLEKLDKKAGLSGDLQNLQIPAKAFLAAPSALDALRDALKRPAAAPVKITSSGLHLHRPTRLARYEMGDSVEASLAYWVDGLPHGKTATIEETTFMDYGRSGAVALESRDVSRGNGGPYIVRRELPLKDSRGFIFRAIVGGAQAHTVSEKIDVAVAPDFDASLATLAAADHQALSCDFRAAATSYALLEQSLAEPAAVKRQYADLLAAAQKRRVDALKNAEALDKVLAAAAASGQDADPKSCDYQASRTESAIKALSGFPAGCDRHLGSLRDQLDAILRGRADQAAFNQGFARGRSQEKACQFSAAAESWTQALSILDANPDARCGALESTAKHLDDDIAKARVLALWTREIQAELAEAELLGQKAVEQGGDPAAILRIVNKSLARIPTLSNASCFSSERDSLRRVQASAGLALAAPADGVIAGLMPDDGQLVRTSGAVSEERRRIESAAAVSESKRAAEQAPPEAAPDSTPSSPEGLAEKPGAPKAPPPKPAKRRKAARRSLP